jgi:ABC-type branched-subunit amino acid transport system substrate-binding protein
MYGDLSGGSKMGSPPDVVAREREQHLPMSRRSPPGWRQPTLTPPREAFMAVSPSAGGDPIRVGVIADQTGPLSFVGLANANVARMVIGDINAKGGLLGRQLELCLEDSATDDAVAAAKGAKLVEQDQVDVVFGGIYSSTRQAIKEPVVVEGKTL